MLSRSVSTRQFVILTSKWLLFLLPFLREMMRGHSCGNMKFGGSGGANVDAFTAGDKELDTITSTQQGPLNY